ncbi:uncharacterized protein C8Q71DRAFT_863017 [Rhodofomes roseus]|uniref:RNA polymerase II-associated protein 3 n=1 Tax=Rhodofomes roseus TaxID=34475 RepID=A0ABQ8JZ93_9APHY|nr:uncharacterized protein C8Q71DRAFT_863017 [Rhodofomes roseus]KAH9829630.1 hypothetical protein C8Q71DRAFT_863017 [Rhodofomes roseus]
MSVPKGQAEKDKGNAAFKAGDFPTAIGHYSAAIVADPTNPTYPLNRAAAYLKLGKNEDAERDCDKVLTLDRHNVKATFRRGQAKAALQRLAEARADFWKVLEIEPANDAVKAELKKIEDALKAQGVPKPKKQPVDIPAPPLASGSAPAAAPKRRRVPIEIVEGPAPSTSKAASATAKPADNSITPVSSRPLTDSVQGPSSPAPKTFQRAKEARTAARPGVGGGIFRPNGEHTIFGEKQKQTSSPPAAAPSSPHTTQTPAPAPGRKTNGAPRKPPKTLFEFSGEWEKQLSAEDRWDFLSGISPTALPSLFQSSLEAPLLTSIVDTLRDVLTAHPEEKTRERVREYMIGLSRVQRFSTVVLFMSVGEKQSAKEAWQLLGGGEGEKAWGVS